MMSTDKAYLLGLIIGGGKFGSAEDVLTIKLPYKKWGSYIENPQRASQISRDIINVVSPMFYNTYGLNVSFEISENFWKIICNGDTSLLKEDLKNYGIYYEGEICTNADISAICSELIDDNLKRRFIAGLADSIGSMARSQRRFSDENQIISFEIKGFNYKLVCYLCRLLHSINCIPDQINWNHPNIHCTNNPYYSKWNKGFKLRILLDQYSQFGAFAFRTKAESAIENLRLQQRSHKVMPCYNQKINITPSCIHPAENDILLPELIRGGHYIHYRHFCVVLGCEYAPYQKILAEFDRLGELIFPFPILCKDSLENIKLIIDSDPLLSRRKYTEIKTSIKSILEFFQDNKNALLFGTTPENGYPIKTILQAISFIIADDNELFGNRPKRYIEIIERHIKKDESLCITILKPDLLTPLVIVGNNKGTLIGAKNPKVYEKLITKSSSNPYKIFARQITEEDLLNEK